MPLKHLGPARLCCANFEGSPLRRTIEVDRDSRFQASTNRYSVVASIVAIRIVQLGTPRAKEEGLRIGTVRRPPRGVPKACYAARNYYDVWFPNLAPSVSTLKLGLTAQTVTDWKRFTRAYRAEMAAPEPAHTIKLFAALSHECNFSVGCYCQDEERCHRTILRDLLREQGACVTV